MHNKMLQSLVFKDVSLTSRVECKYLAPYLDQRGPVLVDRALQQLQNVRKDSYRQSKVNRARPKGKKPPQQYKSANSMGLGQENLKDDREFLRWIQLIRCPPGILLRLKEWQG